MDTLIFAINAVFPIVLLIILGNFLMKKKMFNEDFIKMANRFVFKVALPVSLFINVYDGNISNTNWSIVIFSCLMIIILFLIGLTSVIVFCKDEKRRGVILQNVFRSNYSIIGIPLVVFLANGNNNALSTAALIAATSIPLFNILAVVSLTVFVKDSQGKKIGLDQLFIRILKNPLIIGIFIGVIVVLMRPIFPFTIKEDITFLYSALVLLGKVASPLALVVLGASFKIDEIKDMYKDIIHGVLFRSFISPFLALGVAVLLVKNDIITLNANDFPALIALFGAPSAVSSVVMSYELDNDGRLAGQIVVWSSVCSVISLMLIIMGLKSLGMI